MKRWKIVVLLSVVFLLGMLAGGLLTVKLYKYHVRKMVLSGSAGMLDLTAKRLGSHLNLNEEQKQQLRVIIHDTQQEMKVVRKQADPQITEILNRAEGKVRAILKPDQTKKFDEMVVMLKTKWNEFKKE